LTNVVVEQRDLVSGPTDGWKLAMMTFAFERGTAQNAFRFERAVERLAELIRRLDQGNDPILRQRLAHAKILATIHRLNQQRALSRVEHGGTPGLESSLGKLFWSEMDRNHIQELGLAVQGMLAALSPDDSHAIDAGAWQEAWLYSQAETIFAGSSEIQRNIIAERVLGLPRSR
jgi:alkylation response protein AidB-like acyl-CoA dehydrogenase